MFQHSSGIKETLNGSDYDLDIRNGDTDRAINLIVGTIGSTPEISVNEANVNLLGHLDFTHTDVSGSQRVKIDNPDSDGIIFHSINGANIGEFSSTGLHINGALTETSDKRLKENVKEIDAKKCIESADLGGRVGWLPKAERVKTLFLSPLHQNAAGLGAGRG